MEKSIFLYHVVSLVFPFVLSLDLSSALCIHAGRILVADQDF
jgi:hypothetical protein